MPPSLIKLCSPARALVLAALVALALSGIVPALAPGSARAVAPSSKATETAPLLRSRLLWATIDVCNATDQPDTIGIRGSMPGDHVAHDAMFMRFRLQYMNTTTKAWVDLTKGAAEAYTNVGTGASARQAGRSFQLNPVAGQPAFTLRGVVNFEWRRRGTVVAQASRATSAGRVSLAGSDPEGFSAATCLIG
ncbi:MAG TPA: hypothetical protein VN817_07340 [Solirubrobacteraceae bacterium]|nr:hypothetical protein [Solirubrobacteraceae bacterium]